jgi:hypothetical protein
MRSLRRTYYATFTGQKDPRVSCEQPTEWTIGSAAEEQRMDPDIDDSGPLPGTWHWPVAGPSPQRSLAPARDPIAKSWERGVACSINKWSSHSRVPKNDESAKPFFLPRRCMLSRGRLCFRHFRSVSVMSQRHDELETELSVEFGLAIAFGVVWLAARLHRVTPPARPGAATGLRTSEEGQELLKR